MDTSAVDTSQDIGGSQISAPVLVAGSDTGRSDRDGITSARSLTVTGTATSGRTVTVFDDRDKDGVVDAGETSFSVTLKENESTYRVGVELAEGTHYLRAVQSGADGPSALSAWTVIDVDTTAPTIPLLRVYDGSNVDLPVDGDAVVINATAWAGDIFVSAVTIGAETPEPVADRLRANLKFTNSAGKAAYTNLPIVTQLPTNPTGTGVFTAALRSNGPAGTVFRNQVSDGRYTLTAAVEDIAGNAATPVSRAIIVDTKTPTLVSAAVEGDRLVLGYGESLDARDGHLPTADRFTVTVGAGRVAVRSVAVDGQSLVLTLAAPVRPGQIVSLGYVDPTDMDDLAALQDRAGNDVATFSGRGVDNTTPNVGPTLIAERVTVAQRTQSAGNVLSNDRDADGGVLSVTGARSGSAASSTVMAAGGITLAGAHGSLTLAADGAYTYAAGDTSGIPVGGTGSDQFFYLVSDGQGGNAETTLTITVTAPGQGTSGADTFFLTGGTGTARGGAGDDTYYVDGAGDVVVEAVGGGTDTIYASANYTLGTGQEIERLVAASGSTGLRLAGNAGANAITGSAGADTLSGGAGNDALTGGAGADVLDGGTGNDTLIGGGGSDRLTGGAGADVFAYAAASETGPTARDTIVDFVRGTDRIDLSRIDADATVNGDQSFTFVGTGAFTRNVGGQLHAVQSGRDAIVEGDVNGDRQADFQIVLTGVMAASLSAGDFAL